MPEAHDKTLMKIVDRYDERGKPSTKAQHGRVTHRVTVECPVCRNNKSLTTTTVSDWYYYCDGKHFIREES